MVGSPWPGSECLWLCDFSRSRLVSSFSLLFLTGMSLPSSQTSPRRVSLSLIAFPPYCATVKEIIEFVTNQITILLPTLTALGFSPHAGLLFLQHPSEAGRPLHVILAPTLMPCDQLCWLSSQNIQNLTTSYGSHNYRLV